MDVQTSADTIAVKAASAAQWGGSGVAFTSGSAHFLGMATDEWTVVAAIVGMAVGVLGLITSLYFRWQHLQLARLRARARDAAVADLLEEETP